MKHIKQFEEYSKNNKYIVGTYVYIKRNPFTPEEYSNFGQIKGKYYELGGHHKYKVLLFSGEEISADDDTILRKMTKDEIEKHKLEIDMKKYNL